MFFAARLMALLALIATLLGAGAAHAHHPRLSLIDIVVGDRDVEITLTSDLSLFDGAARLDADGDTQLSEAELLGGRDAIERSLLDRVRVATPEAYCGGALTELRYDARRTAGIVDLRYTCDAPLGTVEILNRAFSERSGDHQFVGTILEEDREHRVVFNRRDPLVRYEATPPDAPEPVAQTDDRVTPTTAAAVLSTYLALGVEHILIGLDHILFILSLLLVARRLRDVLILVTTFTLAHSITLALAALGVLAPPPEIVEPIIALSIGFVAVENILREEPRVSRLETQPRGRPLIVFAFGLIHGFGFAGVLAELGLAEHTLTSLVGFNLGVEIGQLGIVLLVWPLLARLGFPRPRYYRFAQAVSMVIALASLWWLIERTLLT